MIPRDDFTPFGYLDNPYHAWKLNPGGVLRSLEPLGMGWQPGRYWVISRRRRARICHVCS